MPEQIEKSLESQIQLARPRRAEIKRVPLTPEEKEFLGEIMAKAVAAEKAKNLAKAIEFYQEYRDELLKIKKEKEKKKEGIIIEKIIKAAKKSLKNRRRAKSFHDMLKDSKFILHRDPSAASLVDTTGDLLDIYMMKPKIIPAIVGMRITSFIADVYGFDYLLIAEEGNNIGIIGNKKFVLDHNAKLLAKPAQAIVNIDNDIFIKTGAMISFATPPTTLNDIDETFQDDFIQKDDGLYWKKAVS